MRLNRPLAPALLVLVVTVAACAPASTSPTAAPLATAPVATPKVAAATPAPAATAAAKPAAIRIEVTLTDALKIEPASMTVPAGVPITFVVRNAGASAHEFTLGDTAEQEAHEKEMAGMSSMEEDEENAIGVPAGATKELTFTFATPGEQLAACHVAGHYLAGMKAAITVTP